MAMTSLPFYRKNQSLYDMEKERPKHMAALRDAICNATDDVDEQVRTVAREFTGGRSHEDEIRHVLPGVKHLMHIFDFTYINSAEQMEEMVEMTLEPSEVFRFDMLAASTVKDYHRKLMDFLPERFQEMMADLRRIVMHLNMYCVSFCPSDITKQSTIRKKNVYLETPMHYHLKRKDYAKTIEMHMKNIENMSKAYRSAAGVTVKVFGSSTNEVARRCNCGDIPFLLLFPEACFNIKFACAGIRKWVEADRDYNEFVRNDIQQLEQRKIDHSKIIQEIRQRIGNLEYNTKQTRRHINQLETEMATMARSEQLLLERIEKYDMDIKVMNIELTYQEEQRQTLRETAVKDPNISEAELVEKLTEIAAIISKIRLDIPETRNQILAIKHKQRVVIEKRELLNKKIADLKEFEKQKLMARGSMHDEKIEQDKIDTALMVLKDIYLKKTSPDLTKKIYNCMPIQPRNARHMPRRPQAQKPRADPLDRASRVVANQIESNWTELYRTLPFYPQRGEFEKDVDIDRTAQKLYKVEDKYKARESLEKWRARNTLANVESLKDTLRKMGKQNIVDAIDRKAPKPEKTPKAKAKQHWNKLKKFKSTLGKIMALQTQTHVNKLETHREGDRSYRRVQFDDVLNGMDPSKHVKTVLKSSAILMAKAVAKKKVLPAIPKIKAY